MKARNFRKIRREIYASRALIRLLDHFGYLQNPGRLDWWTARNLAALAHESADSQMGARDMRIAENRLWVCVEELRRLGYA